MLDHHFQYKPNIKSERHRFRSMMQEGSENVMQFAHCLHQHVARCNFTDTGEYIRDQIMEKVLDVRGNDGSCWKEGTSPYQQHWKWPECTKSLKPVHEACSLRSQKYIGHKRGAQKTRRRSGGAGWKVI